MKKKYWRTYVDSQGSHAEQIETDLVLADYAPPAPPLFVSAPSAAVGFAYLRLPAGWDGGWHPTPRRQLFVLLRGTLEGEVSDGRVIRIEQGDVVLLEDTSGAGHSTRVVGDEDTEALVITLP
ncbi:MAG TPA: cupin domain-containing protein [Candidatus Dormibacteraeota bacterium]|nr:cupin domain-containing protein [Candidatus Dormibacteraeota bacterium]